MSSQVSERPLRSPAPSGTTRGHPDRRDRVGLTSALLLIAVGGTVLAGWLADIPVLRTLIPGTNPMVASTAACFILCGGSLWLQRGGASSPRAWLGRGLGLLVGVIGALKLTEYATGADLGVDQTLNAINPGPFPGVMAAPTAITFVLVGTALAVLDLETRRGGRPAQALAALGLLFPLFGLIGRLYGVPTLSSLLSGTVVMALHTALAFLVLCGAILAHRPDLGLMRLVTSRGPAGLLLGRLLPAAVLALVLVGWLRLEGERAGLFGTELGAALLVATSLLVLAALILLSARSLDRAGRATGTLASIVESSDDAIYSKSPQGVLTSWNRAAEDLYGYRAEEVVGKPVSLLIPTHRAGEEKVILRQIVQGNTVSHVETERLRKDGHLVPVSLSVSPIRDAGGEIVGAAVIGRDISERRRRDDEVRRAREQAEEARSVAEEASRAKSEFLSRMSHELRTPLNAILGFGQLLQMEELEPEARESVDVMVRSGRHLLDLINEVLDISRIEAGRLNLSLEPVALQDVAEEAMEMIRPLAAERGIRADLEVGPLRARYVLADRQRLKQVLLNLLSNGVKYNREGGALRVSFSQADSRVRTNVSDSGPGIAPEDMERLFRPFERLTLEEAVEGTGLGLALSKGLVEAMGGTIGASSAPGEGTTFRIDLEEARPLVAEEREAVAIVPSEANRSDGPRTVLYVEDNPSNLRLVERVAARRPHVRLLTAMQGGIGLDLARRHRPHLLLLDLHLPDMNGEEVLKKLRADPATAAIPVVVLSADATPGAVKRLLQAGARSYLTKPLDMRRFVRLLDEA